MQENRRKNPGNGLKDPVLIVIILLLSALFAFVDLTFYQYIGALIVSALFFYGYSRANKK